MISRQIILNIVVSRELPLLRFFILFSILIITLFSYSQDEEALEEVAYEQTDSTKFRSKMNTYPYVFYIPESKFADGYWVWIVGKLRDTFRY